MSSIVQSKWMRAVIIVVMTIEFLILAIHFDAGKWSLQPASKSNNESNLLNSKDTEGDSEEAMYSVSFQKYSSSSLRNRDFEQERKLKPKSDKSDSGLSNTSISATTVPSMKSTKAPTTKSTKAPRSKSAKSDDMTSGPSSSSTPGPTGTPGSPTATPTAALAPTAAPTPAPDV
ncbi:hypothetical protein IV203_034288 [Nitzschia inconspicua]|uniref:Uncharacterized protein n=1 Tax=Nitzschia inconspicua TaxID=303405 RepID=A0A9K3M3S5_9STRA|nr:hypothetical protein IV203_034288 [Nitzschia inconspicua]